MNSLLTYLFKKYSGKFLSKWTVLAIDVITVVLLYPIAVIIRNNFEFSHIDYVLTLERTISIIAVYLLSFIAFGSFKSVIRQTGIADSYIIAKSTLTASLSLIGISLFIQSIGVNIDILSISRSVIIIHFLISLTSLIAFRFFIKAVFHKVRQLEQLKNETVVMIYGSGEMGEITRHSLERELQKKYRVQCFIDDNTTKQGKKQNGIPVLSADVALKAQFVNKHRINQVIIAINKLSKEKRKSIIEDCIKLNVETKIVPAIESWIQNDFSPKEIKRVAIEDLLGREPISLSNSTICKELDKKVILITGAAGSIGSEIARQVIAYNPSKVVMVDQAESPLYDLQMFLERKHPDKADRLVFIVADVTRFQHISSIVGNNKPDIIYHAAAYKHVPLMEQYPIEAARVNLIGTRNLADIACKFDVSKFVLVSTDKAINPTNVMGATKRAAEIYVQSKNASGVCSTKFITTRFGNVLGSNGSVVPLFKKQIEEGGPVCVTHPDVMRYFMTIPEACNLVLEAGAIGKNGQILVFDMGQSVKILHLAEKMIRLMGKEPHKDIKIEFTGLRPGEKLIEEVVSNQEENLPTHHPKIMISKTKVQNYINVLENIAKIEKMIFGHNEWGTVKQIKQMVPEFISNNSNFSILDKNPNLTAIHRATNNPVNSN